MTLRGTQQSVLDLLRRLDSLEPVKELFWSQLNYDRVNQPLSRRGWSETATRALAEDPVLFAAAGEDSRFHIVYCRLASDRLLVGLERPVISRLLRDHELGLFVFSNARQDRWHFVNSRWDKEVGKRRVFRRITVGPEERLGNRLRTAAERLCLMDVADLADLSPLGIQQRHDEAFDVESVTKDFFRVFAHVFHKVADDIARVPALRQDAGRHAQLLLDRMLFLYFIQKKGWLDQKQDYLHTRFLECWREDPKGSTYYSKVLYPLFLCLSDPGCSIDGVGSVPFLNGGLFEESSKLSQSERLERTGPKVRNSTFKIVFDDLLERFNFTVTEDTPLDIEVAIDPEMLGKIFESLILQLEKEPGKDLRKLTGSYYTPRSIVHFMCQEALKEYLATQLANGDSDRIQESRERIETLLGLPPADHLEEDEVSLLGGLFTSAEADLLRQAVLRCRVCDPAVGSGAFLVGMLHEMVATTARLDLRLHGVDILGQRNYDYDLKRQIIESCLYGVDIQEQAVRLCELRQWLSLVVDYEIDPRRAFAEATRDIPSLPNLSYRVLRGDSLLERLLGHVIHLDRLAGDAQTKELIGSLQADKRAYFREPNTLEKRSQELRIVAKQARLAEHLIDAKRESIASYQTGLFGDHKLSAKEQKVRTEFEAQQTELDDLKAKVAVAKDRLERLSRGRSADNYADLETLRRQYFNTGDDPSFIWRVDFAEVFADEGGFDIVVANPPYVSFGLRGNKAAAKTWADTVRRLYPGSAEYKISLYALFLDIALRIAGNGGVISYITPDSFLLGRYFSKLRGTILEEAAIRKIVIFEEDFWKSGVVGRPTIPLLQRGMPPHVVRVGLCRDIGSIGLGNMLEHSYSQDYFETLPYNRFRLFFSPTAMAFVQAMERDSLPLGNVARITTGVRSKSGQKNVISTSCSGSKWKRGIVSGGQVLPYRVKWEGHYLHIDRSLLWAGGWDPLVVERPKLMIRQTGDTIIAAIDNDHLYHLNNVHSLAPRSQNVSLPFLCAVLNSRLMNRYYHLISLERGRAMAQTDIETLELLPMPQVAPSTIKCVESLVADIDCSGARDQIEETLVGAYGLTDELVAYLRGEELYPVSAGLGAQEGV